MNHLSRLLFNEFLAKIRRATFLSSAKTTKCLIVFTKALVDFSIKSILTLHYRVHKTS